MEEKKNAFWRRVIVSKYGVDRWGWVPKRVPRYRLSRFWAFMSFGDAFNIKGVVFNKSLVSKWERGVMFIFGLMIGRG